MNGAHSRDGASSAHRRAAWLLVGCTLLWSVAGAVTRALDAPEGYAITLWRSLFAGIFVLWYLARGGNPLRALVRAGGAGVVSGVMWAIMFCCFMIALSRTTVANTLIVYSTAPLLTAGLSALVLRTRIAASTWLAIALALGGLAYMFGTRLDARRIAGMWIACGVPIASAINLVVLKRSGARVDLIPAIALGCVISIVVMLPLAWPLSISAHDLALLAFLGIVQLGVPCVMMLHAMRHLAAAEASLIDLLEIVFGVLWAWLLAGETPDARTLIGGTLVLLGVVLCELGAARALRRAGA